MTWQSTKKRVAAFVATSVISTLGGASLELSPAAAAVPAAQTTTAFCVNVPAGYGGFTDIAGSIHRKTIECLAFSEITTGKTATTFAPSDPVTRGQMASFIARAIDTANELERVPLPSLPSNPPNKFSDDNGTTHEANINRLAAAGIVGGTTATTFSPNDTVTRGQMATFINNTQKFLSGGTPFTTNQDYFVDDETSVHEANINGIASAGITAGVDATHYAPALPVLRANMATFITRYLAVLHKYGIINALAANNATLTFTPTTSARLMGAAEPSTTDERLYTATGLAAGSYRVTLFQRSLVSVDTGPVYTFTEEGSTGLANAGTVGGRIVAVKGAAVTAAQSVGAITPTDGSISVTVDAVDYSKLLPVIFTDQGGANTGLNLDAQDKPSEPFGVGGELETLPEPAATGVLAGDATVVFADETANLIVGQIGSTQRTYLYDTTGDTFYRDSVAPANTLTLAQFEAALSTGDRLDATTSYQSTPAGASIFVLENVSPPAPTAQVTPPVGETTAVITITDLIAGATAKVYVGADGAAFGASPLKATATIDANASLAGFQVNLTGLTAGTSYEFYATQTVSGEESDPTTKVAGPATSLVTASTGPPSMSSASLSANRMVLTANFSEAITPTTTTAVTAAKFTVVCSSLVPPPSSTAGASIAVQDSDTLVVTLAGAVPNDLLSTCTASVAADAVRDGTNTPNNAQSGVALS